MAKCPSLWCRLRPCPRALGATVSVGLGGVVLLQSAQHGVTVLGQRPVLVRIDDEGDGVDAVVPAMVARDWDARRWGQ